ncbi:MULTISPECIES: septum formation family protein [unclassified Microbacterium]|uniref:septum formation family protein n=1 Tax=unclassified Microbacterium TaxID=2609290 RepID=UPI00109C0166|nr:MULTISPECIES: septum formation family protein [unclassified Microbacterium]
MKLYRRPSLLFAAGALTLAVALAGCGTAEPAAERTPTDDGGGVTKSEAPAVAVGDCRLEASSGLPEDAEVVPCAEPHDEEVFHDVELPEGAYSQEAVEASSAECVGDAFTAFVGVAREESTLGVYQIPPTEETWDGPEGRVLSCVLFDPAGQIEGTLEGAAR